MKLMELKRDERFSGYYLLRNILIKTSKNGNPYLMATLTDMTMSVDAKMWNYGGPIGQGDEGKVVFVQAQMQEYNGKPQIIVEKLRLAQPEEYDAIMDTLVPTAPVDRDAAYRRVEELVESLGDGDYRAVCQEMLRRHEAEFRRFPAAKSVHHGFVGGLLMHTVDMMDLADFLAWKYRGIICRDLLLAGALLHDMAKLREFVVSEMGVVTEYSLPGQLLGHLVMGAQEVGEICADLGIDGEKTVLLQHLLLSHHGQMEFGAAVLPQCAEAELLAAIDHIDSRMEIYRETLETTPEGQFSQRIFALERRVYHHNLPKGGEQSPQA